MRMATKQYPSVSTVAFAGRHFIIEFSSEEERRQEIRRVREDTQSLAKERLLSVNKVTR